jgi:hypothetical protein
MADKFQARREGATVQSDLPPTLHYLIKKNPPKNQIVVGSDRAQIRFLEQLVNKKAQMVDRVTDDMLLGHEGLIFHVTMKHQVDLSPELRARTGIWAAEPITKGSAAINTLVKFAATFVPGGDKDLKREVLDRVGDELTKKKIIDLRATIWKAVWLLTGEVPRTERWKDPWEHTTDWLTHDMNVDMRLHSLYNKLVGYANQSIFGDEATEKLGIKPSQRAHLKQLVLDPTKVYKSIALLSRWRQGRMQPYICALQISSIWNGKS